MEIEEVFWPVNEPLGLHGLRKSTSTDVIREPPSAPEPCYDSPQTLP